MNLSEIRQGVLTPATLLGISCGVVLVCALMQLLMAPSSSGHLLAANVIDESQVALSAGQRIEFEDIEAALDRIDLDDEGALQINSHVESILQQATLPWLEQPLPPDAVERIQFLIEKRMPGEAGSTIAAIFPVYYRYKLAVQQQTTKSTPDNLQDEITRFNESVSLQNEILGAELSQQLFGDQNRLTAYLLERRLIAEDTRLSSDEKLEKTRALQQAFTRPDPATRGSE